LTNDFCISYLLCPGNVQPKTILCGLKLWGQKTSYQIGCVKETKRGETMATLPVDYTVSKVVPLLENEVSLLRGIWYELHEIKQRIGEHESFIVNADNKRVGWKVRKLGWKMWVTYPIMRKTSSMMRSVTWNTVKKKIIGKPSYHPLFSPFLSCYMDRSIELHETQLGWDPIEIEPRSNQATFISPQFIIHK